MSTASTSGTTPSDESGDNTGRMGEEPKPPAWWPIGAGIVIVGLLIANILMVTALNDAKANIEHVSTQVAEVQSHLDGRIDDLAASQHSLSEAITALDLTSSISTTTSDAGNSDAPADTATGPLVAGGLTPIVQGKADPEVGRVLFDVEGPNANGETLTIDPADGTIRAWLIWAHWCPYCQKELPALNQWVNAHPDTPGFKIETVTGSIHPERGNPLDQYLDEQDFAFDVIVDADDSLLTKLGVTSFPTWIFTDGDGTIIARVNGMLGAENMAGIFDQLLAQVPTP